jgi:hypothetical protein
MDIISLTMTLAEAIHDSDAIAAWATLNYSRRHKVYVGVDDENLPGAEDCPLVYLFPTGKTSGHGRDTQDHAFLVTCEIYDEENYTPPSRENLVVFQGVQRIEEFRKLVETVIFANLPATIDEDAQRQLETTYSDSLVFPFFQAHDLYTLLNPYAMTMDEFA